MNKTIKVVRSSIIYENPLPQLRSRQSAFPFLCQLKGGEILATSTIGEAFESVDGATHIAFSRDGGESFGESVPMFDKSGLAVPITDSCKVTRLRDGRLMALGYAYFRPDPSLPEGNPVTGGLLDDMVFCSVSEDGGRSWSELQEIACSWGPHVEASGNLIELQDGTLMAPITGFPDWEGKPTGHVCGRALRSDDGGRTWSDGAVCMEFDGDPVTCYEMRMCQLASCAVISIGWNENCVTGERLCNHYTVSYDGGRTWSKPISTGIRGQASSVCAIGGERLLALHAVRRDTDRPGIYAYIVDFSDRTWNIVDEAVVWEPSRPMVKDEKMAEIFSFLKFGQPGAILLDDGDVMMSHWYAEDGQYKTVATRISIS